MKVITQAETSATRQAKAELLLAEALDRMLSGQPPPYGRTWTTCLHIKRFLKVKDGAQLETTTTRQAKLNMNTQNPTQSELESRIEQLESACEDLTAQRDELCGQLTAAIKVAVKANDAYDKAIQRGDELLAALKACETDEGALGYLQPAKYARKRFDAINGAVFAAIAKSESNQT